MRYDFIAQSWVKTSIPEDTDQIIRETKIENRIAVKDENEWQLANCAMRWEKASNPGYEAAARRASHCESNAAASRIRAATLTNLQDDRQKRGQRRKLPIGNY